MSIVWIVMSEINGYKNYEGAFFSREQCFRFVNRMNNVNNGKIYYCYWDYIRED